MIFSQRAECLSGNTGGRLHTRTHQGNLGNVFVHQSGGTELLNQGINGFQCLLFLRTREGEGNVRLAIVCGVLDDHVNRNIVARKDREQLSCHTNFIGKATKRDLHFGRIVCNAGNYCLFHGRNNLLDKRSLCIRESRAGMDYNMVFTSEFNCARLQNASTTAGKLKHIVVRNTVELLSAWAYTRVGRVNAFYVGIDLAHIGTNATRKGNCRGVRTATTKRGDVAIGGNALEAGNDHDCARIKSTANSVGINVFDFCT